MLVSQGNEVNLLLAKLLGEAGSGTGQQAADMIPISFTWRPAIQITHPPWALTCEMGIRTGFSGLVYGHSVVK